MTRRHLAPLVLALVLAAPALAAEAPRDLAPRLRSAIVDALEDVVARLALVFAPSGSDGAETETADAETAPLPTEPAEMAGEIDPNG